VEGLQIPKPVTDINEYPRLLGAWSPSALTEHFPPAVPTTTRLARISSFPGFLQGGAHLQLRVQLPSEEVAAIDLKYSALATHTFQGGDTNDHSNQSDGVPTTFDYTNGTKDTEFHPSFRIYVLSARDEGSEGFPWNHGQNCGVAVSRERNEVVYWCESW